MFNEEHDVLHLLFKDKTVKKTLNMSCGKETGKRNRKPITSNWGDGKEEEEREKNCGRYFPRTLWKDHTEHLAGDSPYIHVLFRHICNMTKQQTYKWMKTETHAYKANGLALWRSHGNHELPITITWLKTNQQEHKGPVKISKTISRLRNP